MDIVRHDDLLIYQGDDRPFFWTLTSTDGQPADLTGHTAVAQVRPWPESPTVLHEWSTEDGTATVTDSAVTLLVNDSESWTWDRGSYDVHLIDPSGRHQVIARGAVIVVPTVTR